VGLSPERASSTREGVFQVRLANPSNTDLTVDLSAADPEEGCIYRFEPQRVSVGAGQSKGVSLVVSPKEKPPRGEARRYDFTVRAVPVAVPVQPRAVVGSLEHRSAIPRWVVPAAVIAALLLCCGASAIAGVSLFGDDMRGLLAEWRRPAQTPWELVSAIQTAEAAAAQAALVATQTTQAEGFAATQTGVAGENAATQTAVAESMVATQAALAAAGQAAAATQTAVAGENAATQTAAAVEAAQTAAAPQIIEVEKEVPVEKTVKETVAVEKEVPVLTSIEKTHRELGGETGFLGKPLSSEKESTNGGKYREFRGGVIYWHPSSGAHEVHGLILAKYKSLGADSSFLGYPTTDERETPDGIGRYNHFQGGSIYWTPSTDAHEVHGRIRAKWASLGWEKSFLGYPTTDERETPDGIGRYNHFQGGSIYWTPSTDAHEVHGEIRAKWASMGWEKSSLGYPISDELPIPGTDGRRSTFEGGVIEWFPGRGAKAIRE